MFAPGGVPYGPKNLQHLRIEKAREALELSMQAISEIAWMVGYQDEAHFGRFSGESPASRRETIADAWALL
jgi:transcriptional regulator GlxA family with amidase domain